MTVEQQFAKVKARVGTPSVRGMEVLCDLDERRLASRKAADRIASTSAPLGGFILNREAA